MVVAVLPIPETVEEIILAQPVQLFGGSAVEAVGLDQHVASRALANPQTSGIRNVSTSLARVRGLVAKS